MPGVAIRLLAVLLLACMSGLLYAYLQNIPGWIAVPLTGAFGLEALLYVTACWETARQAVERRLRGAALAAVMTVSGVLPYVVYAVPVGMFRWAGLGEVAALAAVVSFWYVVLPRRRAVDLVFMAVIAAALLGGVFQAIYGQPAPRLKVGILGELMWTRLAVMGALSIARMEVKGFGLLPARREWAAGFLNYALFLPAGALLGWLLNFAEFHVRPLEWWQTLGLSALTFLGMLWVVALREEFFFRGMLQEWFDSRLGLVAVSLTFGLTHLPFREFPNWRFAILAAVAGLCYGRAYLTTRSVRAAMVTHALVNTTWKMFFS